MFNILKKSKKNTLDITVNNYDGWIRKELGTSLLSGPKRHEYIKTIWDLTSFTEKSFSLIIKEPIYRYAELIQQIPASESHHHSYLGGLLDHSLECMIFSLKLRRQHLLPPGGTAEEQSMNADLWTAAVALNALLHDAGKAIFDVQFELYSGAKWSLLDGVIPETHYRFRYNERRSYKTHSVAAGLLWNNVVTGDVIRWLQKDQSLIDQLMMSVAGHRENAGIIGSLVMQADMASVGQNMGGNVNAISSEPPKHSLQSKLKEGLRYIVKNNFKLNEKGAAGFVTKDALYLVSMRAANELRGHLLTLGIESIPSSNPALFDELQTHNLIRPNLKNKAIWKCKVSLSGWDAELTMLKLSPALIWSDDELQKQSFDIVNITELDTVESSAIKENSATPDANQSSKCQDIDKEPSAALQNDKAKDVDDFLALFEPSQPNVGETKTVDTVEIPVEPSEPPEHITKTIEIEKSNTPGSKFTVWLKNGLVSRKLIMNDTNALVHIVNSQYFIVSPRIFKRYLQEINGTEPSLKEVQALQTSFQRLKIHCRTVESTNIFVVVVKGIKKEKMINGFLLKEIGYLPPPLASNPFLQLKSQIQ